jgi:DNA-binding phage protein
MTEVYNSLLSKLLRELDTRRNDLGMTYAVLAKRTGLGTRTVQRVLTGREGAANFRSVLAIAHSLGARLSLEGEDINTVRLRQAQQKAAKLVSLLQGTSALEAQGLDEKEKAVAEQRTVRDLLASPRSVLWDD